MSETAAAPADAVAPEERDDRMPSGIPFIVANEFAERFCYYGINAILTVYMVRHLRLGEAEATTYHSLFKSGAYFFPLMGAIIADVFWGKYRTILTFSIVYTVGCAVVAFVPGKVGLLVGLFLVAMGTGGIKPCVSTNVGDQFTKKNQHLIERAFSYFYLAINAGSSISIFFCPLLLKDYGPTVAFGVPAVAMFVATLLFWAGRSRYAHVPPAGAKQWLENVTSTEGRGVIANLVVIYFFIACFWALWDQSNGQTWVLQAESSLMDKNLGLGLFDLTVLPAQIQVVNGLMILAMVPVFTFGIYPLWARFTPVTPLRKIGVGLFLVAVSFVVVAWIESRIQAGQTVSAWWQILAYLILTASEVLVSITGLEFSYAQAPLKMKSFVMSMFLLAVSVGNLMTGTVNSLMIRPLQATGMATGAATWVELADAQNIAEGQKLDFSGDTGVSVVKADGKEDKLSGTYLAGAVDAPARRVQLLDAVDRKPLVTSGSFAATAAKVSTYWLVGPMYFLFFAGLMGLAGVAFVFVARRYQGQTYVRA